MEAARSLALANVLAEQLEFQEQRRTPFCKDSNSGPKKPVKQHRREEMMR